MWISLYDWDGLGTATWIGAANYVELLDDDSFYTSLKNKFADPAFSDSEVGWDVVIGTAANLKRLPYQQIPNYTEWTDAVAPA